MLKGIAPVMAGFILLSSLVLAAELPEPEAVLKKPVVIVCFGDSVTLGRYMVPGQTYPDQLRGMLDARYGSGICNVVNAGIPGSTTTDALGRLARDVLRRRPTFVLVNLGLNDSSRIMTGSFRVPPEKYKRNLISMVNQIRDAGSTPILSTITPVIPEYYRNRQAFGSAESEIDLMARQGIYNDAVRFVAESSDIPLVDLASVFGRNRPDLFRKTSASSRQDGLHPNETGCGLIVSAFMTVLQDRLDQLMQPDKKSRNIE